MFVFKCGLRAMGQLSSVVGCQHRLHCTTQPGPRRVRTASCLSWQEDGVMEGCDDGMEPGVGERLLAMLEASLPLGLRSVAGWRARPRVCSHTRTHTCARSDPRGRVCVCMSKLQSCSKGCTFSRDCERMVEVVRCLFVRDDNVWLCVHATCVSSAGVW